MFAQTAPTGSLWDVGAMITVCVGAAALQGALLALYRKVSEQKLPELRFVISSFMAVLGLLVSVAAVALLLAGAYGVERSSIDSGKQIGLFVASAWLLLVSAVFRYAK